MMNKKLAIRLLGLSCCISLANAQATPQDVGFAAKVLGLTPATLASIDVTGSDVEIMLNRLDAEYDQFESYLTAQDAILAANQAIIEYEAKLRIDPSDTESQSALSQSTTDATNAKALADQTRSSLIGELLADLADESYVNEIVYCENPITRLPAPYRLAVSTESEAETLCWAFKMDQWAHARDDTPPTAASQAITSAMSQTDVNIALARVAMHQAANEQAITDWVSSN